MNRTFSIHVDLTKSKMSCFFYVSFDKCVPRFFCWGFFFPICICYERQLSCLSVHTTIICKIIRENKTICSMTFVWWSLVLVCFYFYFYFSCVCNQFSSEFSVYRNQYFQCTVLLLVYIRCIKFSSQNLNK